jgi:hypothetical protein
MLFNAMQFNQYYLLKETCIKKEDRQTHTQAQHYDDRKKGIHGR